jgi:hypothetical protein
MTDIWARDALPNPDLPTMPYLSFGPAPHQEVRADVAQMMLTAWHAKNPKQFGDALRDAMISSNGSQP